MLIIVGGFNLNIDLYSSDLALSFGRLNVLYRLSTRTPDELALTLYSAVGDQTLLLWEMVSDRL